MTEFAQCFQPTPDDRDAAPDDLDAAADAAVEACDGDPRTAVKALLSLNAALEDQLASLSGAVSTGFARGRPGRGRAG